MRPQGVNIQFLAIQPGPIRAGTVVYCLRITLVVVMQVEEPAFGSGQQRVFLAGEGAIKKIDIADFILSLDSKPALATSWTL